jgi:hypothetical protein
VILSALALTSKLRNVLVMQVRKIVHIDMDTFYASVEQRDDSQLRQTRRSRDSRSVVWAASYDCETFWRAFGEVMKCGEGADSATWP